MMTKRPGLHRMVAQTLKTTISRPALFPTRTAFANFGRESLEFEPKHKPGIQQRLVSTSTFDLFKIGVGPSSSHTVGPMKAANDFLNSIDELGKLEEINKVDIHLYGSLALTGKGHATDHACFLGLSGIAPEKVENAPEILQKIEETNTINLGGRKSIPFNQKDNLKWNFDRLKEHPNAMKLQAFCENGSVIHEQTYFSIGGGFIRTYEEMHSTKEELAEEKESIKLDLHFKNMKELLKICDEKQMSIADVMKHNEIHKGYTEEEVNEKLDHIWSVMNACIERGINSTDEHLPGSIKVKRRAPKLYAREKRFARSNSLRTIDQPLMPLLNGMSKLSMYAIAVNEENAGGWSQIVTAPTNGASGVVPSCLKHLLTDLLHPRYVEGLPHMYDGHLDAMVKAPRTFLLTAAAVGALIKQNSSISGAEAGCMGEVGSATSMAAAGLAACLGGTPQQVENAAEMAMEHSLGLTCDPVGGLVQIPCIERNAVGSTKAATAAVLALMAEHETHVSFDTVIQVMKGIGEDMHEKYKETSLGGLATASNDYQIPKSLPEC